MSIKRFLTTYTLYLGLLFLILGIILAIVGILGIFYYEQSPDPMRHILEVIGDWKYWCILLGPICLIGGGFYFFDNISKRKEFKKLIDTTSKSKLIKNLDRLEYLAWKLTPEHQNQLARKKRKFHIK